MAACLLDLSHPIFLASRQKIQEDPELEEALAEMKRKIEAEHTSCGRVVQKFYGDSNFTELHGKIWKYDWGKSGASGRKSWRMVVVVPEPAETPLKLIAGAIYAKSSTDQLPLKELSSIFTAVITPSIAASATEEECSGEFHRVPNGDGQTRSICMSCYELVTVSMDIAFITASEKNHLCGSEVA